MTFTYRVRTVSEMRAISSARVYDVCIVMEEGHSYVWNGHDWDSLTPPPTAEDEKPEG